MNRKEWKTCYRLLRVAKREATKAIIDTMMYGSGFVHIPADGSDPERIHPSEMTLESLEESGEINIKTLSELKDYQKSIIKRINAEKNNTMFVQKGLGK